MSDTWATTGYDHKPTPNVFVQWKGTDACLDFRCICGFGGHFDGDFAYNLRCGECGRLWAIPHTIGMVESEDDGGVIQETDLAPHGHRRQPTSDLPSVTVPPDPD